uniref:Retrotransposon-like protein n=1 Tax=Musa acuminata TaxID=4641 RepID=Q6RZV4_MUSAC|nr:retrotransposon-like protein [Musa acuminata]
MTQNKFEPKKDQVICYECKKPGHYKSDYPQAKKRISKKNALKATWDDSSASEEEESNTEQVAHYALMAIGEEEHDSLISNFDKLKTEYHDSLAPYIKCHDIETLQKENLLLKDTLKKFERHTPSQARSKRWYLDSGCSRHMTGDPSQFSKLTSIDEGYVTFGDNNKGKIIGKGTIGNKSNFFIEDVLLVDGLKHNLLSISQLCDKGYIVKFESNA